MSLSARDQCDSIRTELLMLRIRTEEAEEKSVNDCSEIRRGIARALDRLETIEETLPLVGLDST